VTVHQFALDISTASLLKYYRGKVKWVLVTTQDGVRIRFPVDALRPYVTRDGVKGSFRLVCDERQRLLRFDKIDL